MRDWRGRLCWFRYRLLLVVLLYIHCEICCSMSTLTVHPSPTSKEGYPLGSTAIYRSNEIASIQDTSNTTYAKYSKLTYQYEKRMFIRDNFPREFRYFKQWSGVSSYLRLKASSLDENNRRLNMYVFMTSVNMDNREGEPFYPFSFDGTTKYEFPTPDGKYEQLIKGIEPSSKNPKNKYINIVVERVNCTTCAHSITLTMELHQGVAIAVSSVLGSVILAAFIGTILGAIFCRC